MAGASQQQTHTVTAASDDVVVDVADDTSPAGGPAQQQDPKGGEPDGAEDMLLDDIDARLVKAGDDSGQVGALCCNCAWQETTCSRKSKLVASLKWALSCP